MRFLFVDRILELVPGEHVRGIKHITRDDAYLVQDEQGQLVFPFSLVGETLGQLAAWNVMLTNDFKSRPVAGIVDSVHLYRHPRVGETLLLESYIDQLDDAAVQYHSLARVNDETVLRVSGALGPLLPMSMFISEEEVRHQFEEIHRPGDISLAAHHGQTLLLSTATVSPSRSMAFDSLLASEPGVSLTAEKRIARAAPYFPDHFPKKPVLPMTVLLECQLNLAKEFLKRAAFPKHYQATMLRKIKMNEFVNPGDVVVCHLKMKQRDEQQLVLSYRSEVDGKRVCVMEVLMKAEGDLYE